MPSLTEGFRKPFFFLKSENSVFYVLSCVLHPGVEPNGARSSQGTCDKNSVRGTSLDPFFFFSPGVSFDFFTVLPLSEKKGIPW